VNENEVVYQRFPGDTLSGDLYSYRPGIYLATFSQTEGTQPNSWNSWNAPPPGACGAPTSHMVRACRVVAPPAERGRAEPGVLGGW
jgi:hypothetical protein